MSKYFIAILLSLIVSMPVSASDNSIADLIINYKSLNNETSTSGAISSGGVQKLKEEGFKTIIDLRTKNEGVAQERKEVESSGMSYINIPVTGEGINDQQLASFTEVMENIEKPVLIHCGSGNRVGAMWTTYQLSKGVALNEAVSQGRKMGMKPELEAKIIEACKTC